MPDDKKQLHELIEKSSYPLILISPHAADDTVSAALGLFLMFKKKNKEPQIACSSPIREKFLFLPESGSIISDIAGERVYKISINVGRNGLEEVSYDQEKDLLNIYLTVRRGNIKVDSIKLDSSKFKYDLVLTLGVSKLDLLGKIYFDNKEAFSRVPIVNIDRDLSNERFGGVNLIEKSPTYITELVSDIVHSILPSGMDENMATVLLASVISSTDNFQLPHIKSKIFALAAFLIDAGAKRDEIVKKLYGHKGIIETEPKAEIINAIVEKKPDDILKKKLGANLGGTNR